MSGKLQSHIEEFRKLRQEQLNRRGLSLLNVSSNHSPQNQQQDQNQQEPSPLSRSEEKKDDLSLLLPALALSSRARSSSSPASTAASQNRGGRKREPSGKISIAGGADTHRKDADGVVLSSRLRNNIYDGGRPKLDLDVDNNNSNDTDANQNNPHFDGCNDDSDLVDVPLLLSSSTLLESPPSSSLFLTPQRVMEEDNNKDDDDDDDDDYLLQRHFYFQHQQDHRRRHEDQYPPPHELRGASGGMLPGTHRLYGTSSSTFGTRGLEDPDQEEAVATTTTAAAATLLDTSMLSAATSTTSTTPRSKSSSSPSRKAPSSSSELVLPEEDWSNNTSSSTHDLLDLSSLLPALPAHMVTSTSPPPQPLYMERPSSLLLHTKDDDDNSDDDDNNYNNGRPALIRHTPGRMTDYRPKTDPDAPQASSLPQSIAGISSPTATDHHHLRTSSSRQSNNNSNALINSTSTTSAAATPAAAPSILSTEQEDARSPSSSGVVLSSKSPSRSYEDTTASGITFEEGATIATATTASSPMPPPSSPKADPFPPAARLTSATASSETTRKSPPIVATAGNNNNDNNNNNIPPPETLWERNKTLVKEVRFADQTCVELSARNYALEQQVLLLQHQMEQDRRLFATCVASEQLEAVNAQHLASIGQHEQQVRSLISDKVLLTQQLQERTQPGSSAPVWKDRVAELEALKRLHEQQILSLTAEKALLTQQLQELTQSAGSALVWKDRVTEVEALNLELSQSTEVLKQLLESTKEDLEGSNLAVEKASAHCTTLQERVSELEALSGDQAFSASARKQQLDDALAEKQKLDLLVTAHQNRISDLEQLCQEHSHSLLAQKQQLDDSNSSKHCLEADLENSLQARRQLEGYLEDSKRSRAAAEAQCSNLQKRITELEALGITVAKEKLGLEEELEVARKELGRVRTLLAETNASNELKAAVMESRLAEELSSLNMLREECSEAFPRVTSAVRSTALQVEHQASVLGNSVSQSSRDLILRMSRLESELHILKESTDFQAESQKAEAASVERDMSTLTGTSARSPVVGDGNAPVQDPLQIVAVEELMNATFDSRSYDKSNDLELMEEARFDTSLASRDSEGRALTAVSDVTDDHDHDNDSFSSIEGLSHLFSPSNGIDLSLSVSRSRDHPDSEGFVKSPTGGIFDTDVQSSERDNLRHLADTLGQEKAKVEADLMTKTLEAKEYLARLTELTSCLALVREERDALQSKLNHGIIDSTPQKVSRNEAKLTTPITGNKSCHKCQLLRERIDSLVEVRDAVSIERDEIREQLEGLRLEKEDVMKDLRHASSLLKQQSQDYSTELARLQERCDLLVQESSVVQEEQCAAQAKADEFQRERDRLSQELETLQLEYSDSSHKRLALQAELDRCHEEMEAAAVVCRSLEEKVQMEARQRQVFVEEQQRWHSELASLNTKHMDASKQVETLQEVLRSLSKEKEEVLAELGAMVSRNEEVEKARECLQSELASCWRQKEELVEEQESWRSRLKEMELQLSDTVSEFQAAKESLESELASYRRQKEVLDIEHAETLASLEVAKTSLAESSEAVEKLERFEAEQLDLQRAIEDLQKELDSVQAELKEKENLVDCLKESQDQSTATISSLRQEVEHLNNTKLELDSELLKYKEGLKAAEEFASHAEGLASHAEGRWVQIQSDLSRVEAERDEINAQCVVLVQRIERHEEDYAFMSLRLKEKGEALDLAVQSQENIKTEVKESRDDLEAVRASLEVTAQTKDRLETALAQCRCELRAVQMEAQQAVESRDDANSQLADRDAEVEELRQQVQSLSEQLAEGDRRLAGFEVSLQENEQELASLRSCKEKLESKGQGLRQYIKKLMQKCEEWETYCSSQSQAFEKKLQIIHERMRQMLLERDQLYSAERAMWTSERSNLTAIHYTLEGELDEIAKELMNHSIGKPS